MLAHQINAFKKYDDKTRSSVKIAHAEFKNFSNLSSICKWRSIDL